MGEWGSGGSKLNLYQGWYGQMAQLQDDEAVLFFMHTDMCIEGEGGREEKRDVHTRHDSHI
jgi:hypothetical protein